MQATISVARQHIHVISLIPGKQTIFHSKVLLEVLLILISFLLRPCHCGRDFVFHNAFRTMASSRLTVRWRQPDGCILKHHFFVWNMLRTFVRFIPLIILYLFGSSDSACCRFDGPRISRPNVSAEKQEQWNGVRINISRFVWFCPSAAFCFAPQNMTVAESQAGWPVGPGSRPLFVTLIEVLIHCDFSPRGILLSWWAQLCNFSIPLVIHGRWVKIEPLPAHSCVVNAYIGMKYTDSTVC